MTSFGLKIIAMITMLIDHLGNAWLKRTTFMNVIGRIAFPIFAFQISEGYIHTKNFSKYLLRLFLFALISQIPFNLFHSTYSTVTSLNIFFTLSLGLLCIYCYDKLTNSAFEWSKNKKSDFLLKQLISIIIVVLLGIIAQILKFDYGFFGITIIFLFYVFRKHKILISFSFALACILRYGINIYIYGYNILYIFLALFTILPIIFILLYNGKQGKKIKYFVYIFYPLHLLILYFIFGI